jgi:hypothetical protein
LSVNCVLTGSSRMIATIFLLMLYVISKCLLQKGAVKTDNKKPWDWIASVASAHGQGYLFGCLFDWNRRTPPGNGHTDASSAKFMCK